MKVENNVLDIHMSNNYAKNKTSNNFLLGVLPNNPPDLAAGVAVEVSLLAASLLLFVDVSFVAVVAPPKLNPPVDGACAFAVADGAPKPNPPPPPAAARAGAATAGAAFVAGAGAAPPNNPPPVEGAGVCDFDASAPKLKPPVVAAGLIALLGAEKLNPPPAGAAAAGVGAKLNAIVLSFFIDANQGSCAAILIFLGTIVDIEVEEC